MAREAEALVEGYPTADLDLPGHLQHETPEIDDGADGVELDLPELSSVPYTASRPSSLEAPVQAGLLDPGEDTSELVVAAVAGPSRRRAIPSPIRPPAVGQGAPAPDEESPSPGSCAGSSPGWALPAPSGACQRRGHEKRAVEVAPPWSAAQYKKLDRALLAGDSMRKAAKKAGVGVATAHRRSQAPAVGELRQRRNICRAAFWPWS